MGQNCLAVAGMGGPVSCPSLLLHPSHIHFHTCGMCAIKRVLFLEIYSAHIAISPACLKYLGWALSEVQLLLARRHWNSRKISISARLLSKIRTWHRLPPALQLWEEGGPSSSCASSSSSVGHAARKIPPPPLASFSLPEVNEKVGLLLVLPREKSANLT